MGEASDQGWPEALGMGMSEIGGRAGGRGRPGRSRLCGVEPAPELKDFWAHLLWFQAWIWSSLQKSPAPSPPAGPRLPGAPPALFVWPSQYEGGCSPVSSLM
ncbi:unnamed protein product [Pipistrellus nathusii]|uniref:Uncharacterized protein n=1 Tax=Pipistrellus nathusii TaxID=59473 RepID=A0ABP0A062_PIPNA